MVPFVGASVVLCLSVLAPARFLAGVRRVPGGFEICAPLRRKRTILFADIRQIVAISLSDGDTGEAAVNMLVRTKSASALLEGHVLFQHALLVDLQTLPSFDVAAYERALRHVPSDFREPFGRRFTVLIVP